MIKWSKSSSGASLAPEERAGMSGGRTEGCSAEKQRNGRDGGLATWMDR